jgi:outer membrane protein OmpA-like peptidoglycan-associated protein
MVGDSAVFRYVKDYRFDMRGSLEFASAREGVVQATIKVTDRLSFDVEWHDRYALAFSAVRTVPLPGESSSQEALDAAPAAAVAPIAGAVPSAASAACTLEPLHFKYTEASLSPQARTALDQFAACLAGNGSSVTLVGHCDRRGSRAANQRLGLERADAAAGYLESKGVAAGRIRVESGGAGAPLCTAPTAACHARNRRVVAVASGARP